MKTWKILVAVSLLPATARPEAPTDAARRAAQSQREATQKRQAEADEAGQEPPASPEKDGSVDLNSAAEKLEGGAQETVAPEGAAPAPPEGTATARPQPGGVPAPDTYTVKPGDTLWDLSGRFLNNPWYWPKVWSYNPEISNPHWIYPGNVIRFYPSGEEAPARVEPVAGATPPAAEPEQEAQAEGESVEAPQELQDLSRGTIDKAEPLGEEDAVAVAGPYKVGYTAPKAVSARRDSFVTRRELEESGLITAAFEEKLLLATPDRAYARFHGAAPVKAGESYVVFRTEGPVHHPLTGELFGYKSRILGTARVVAVEAGAATLVITAAYEPIERGNYLGPWSDKLVKAVARRPNQRALDGMIVAAQSDMVTEIGEHHVVFVDKGRADGVEEGNSFSVVRSGDPYAQAPDGAPRPDGSLPKEVIGSLLVIDAKDHASTALVSRSLRELFVGDRVEMRVTAMAPLRSSTPPRGSQPN